MGLARILGIYSLTYFRSAGSSPKLEPRLLGQRRHLVIL